MAKEEKQIIEPQEQQEEFKPLDSEEIISRLEDQREGAYKFDGQTEISCFFGIDPEEEMNESGWSCFLKPQKLPEGLVIVTNQGEISENIEEQLPISYVKKVKINDKSYIISRDAWGNPSVYLEKETEIEEPEGKFKEALEKATLLWEAATLGEDELKETIVNLFGEEVLEIVTNLLSQLEKYPEIQSNKYWSEKIDLWDIAYRGKTVDGALKILKGEDGGLRLPFEIKDSEMLQRCEEVIKKIINQQPLDDQDRFFTDAIKINKIAVRKSIRKSDYYGINDFSRRYAMANLLENLLCRELAGWDIYEQHRSSFDQFSSALEESGYEVPEWFKPYDGNEFSWSFAMDGTRANSGGDYFLDTNSNPEKITKILNHERGHKLRRTAGELGQKNILDAKSKGEQFEYNKYEESFTESLALLVKHGGNVEQAIAENNEQKISYKNGVDRLLKILLVINNHSGDPLMASKLMIDGLKRVAEGVSLSETDLIKEYYDSEIAEEGAFDALMSDFSDKKIIRVKWGNKKEGEEPDLSTLINTIRNSMAEIQYDDLSEQERPKYWGGKDKFEEYKETELKDLEKWPISLLSEKPSPLVYRILQKVKDDPESSKQLQSILDADYKQYSAALKSWLETGEKQVTR